MKIYVAGSWRDKVTVQQVQRALMEAGHSITHDWTAEEGDPNWADHTDEMTPEQRLEAQNTAIVDMGAVAAADVYVGVFEHDLQYRGAWVEYGMALAYGKNVYLVGKQADKCIFSYLAGRMTVEQVIARLKAIEFKYGQPRH